MDNSQKEKQKTTAIRISKLSTILLTSAVIVLSSITAAQLFLSDNNAAFAALHCNETETVCSGGEGGVTVDEGGNTLHGGGGYRSTCTTDSNNIETCTFTGGAGQGTVSGGGGYGASLTCSEGECSGVGSGDNGFQR